MFLDRAQFLEYNQNNYSGLTPAPGLLVNDEYNTNGNLFAYVLEIFV